MSDKPRIKILIAFPPFMEGSYLDVDEVVPEGDYPNPALQYRVGDLLIPQRYAEVIPT